MFGRKPKTSEKAAAPSLDGHQYVTGFRLVILFSALALNAIIIVLYTSVLGTATPSITTYFGTLEDVDWYSTAYLLLMCAFQPVTGQIYSVFRVKSTFLTFLSIVAVGTLISALAKSSVAFIAGRAVAGLGAAGLFNGSSVMIVAAVAPHLRAQLLSLASILVGFGAVAGPLVGGTITEHLGWRWCIWVFLPPIGAIAFIFLTQRIPEQVEKAPALSVVRQIHRKLDLVGLTLFVPACTMLMLAISWGGTKYAWKSATIIALLVVSMVVFGVFLGWISYYKERSLIPPSIMMKPVVFCACLTAFFEGGAYLMIQWYLPLWFQVVKGAGPEKSGVMSLPTCITWIVTGVFCTLLLKTIPYAPVWALAGHAATAIGSGLMTTFTPSTSSGEWIGYQILAGTGRGIAMQMPLLAVQSYLPADEFPYANANILFFQYFGGTIVNCMAKTVFINGLRSALAEFAPHVDAQKVVQSGATEIFRLVAPEDVQGVVLAYNQALAQTFWLPTACAILGAFSTLGLGWHKIGGEKKVKEVEAVVGDKSVDGSVDEKSAELKTV
ncbi:DNA repair protein RAD50 [Massariosphaeria phaeospora]|uniref:DNA repair protein RAD50 n=1 Tax=Massariosphaeria phaeospora TaxID=100035 RepID=A0A7C8M3P6_9PLEO|nr:DNA repair protein RAD50 [Massariosphaeria phaeospora]